MIASKSFQVQSGQAVNVLAVNLFNDEQLVVRYAVDVGCTPKEAEYTDYIEDGEEVVVSSTHNPITLWRPGWYKLVPNGWVNEEVQVHVSQPFPVHIQHSVQNV